MIARLSPLISVVALLAVALAAPHLRAATAAGTIYVDADATGSNNGTSWADAYTDLQSALGAANSGDQVWVAAGTYRPTTGTDRNVSFQMETGVAIYGGFAGTETALGQRDIAGNPTILSGNIGDQATNADNSYHVVVASLFVDGSAVLDGVTVRDGNADGVSGADVGGGLRVDGSPTIANVTLTGNSAASGGGASIKGGTWTDVTITGNTAFFKGGGSYIAGPAALTNVTISGNTAQNGGGIFVLRGTPQLTRVTLTGNSASVVGAAIYAEGGSPVVSESIAWGNGDPVFQIARNAGGFPSLSGRNLIEGGCPGAFSCNPADVIDADPNAPNFSVPDIVPPPALATNRLENRRVINQR